MRFGDSDNLYRHQQKDDSHHPPGTSDFQSRCEHGLFGNPITFVLLVWGALFLLLGVTLAYV